MVLAKLLEDHGKLRALSTELSALLVEVEPCDLARLADCRWRMAREILRHLPTEDRHVYQRLEHHPDCAAVEKAKQFKAELEAMYSGFHEHTEDWTPERITTNWQEYRQVALRFQRALLARLDREENDLYPLLAGAPEITPQRRPEDRNWAGDGWTIKAKIGGG